MDWDCPFIFVSKSCVTVIWNTTWLHVPWEHQPYKIVEKHHATIGICYCYDTSQMLPAFISYEAFLSFFGLGLPITVPSLGRLISDYSQNVTTNAYLFWIPLTTLVLVSLSLFVVGQNLADASDPRTHR